MDTPSNVTHSLPTFVALLPSVSSPSVPSLSLPHDLSAGGTSHDSYNGLKSAQSHYEKRRNVRVQGHHHRPVTTTTISMLSDDDFLEIFDWYRIDHDLDKRGPIFPEAVWNWHILVHVCRRWRQIVFASPLRLNLQILCTHGTPVRDNLVFWPTFPIVIEYGTRYGYILKVAPTDEDNVIAALEHPSRVCDISLRVSGLQLGKMATVMHEPYPALTQLFLTSQDRNVPGLPSQFLGTSAPGLQELCLDGIPFSALPTLLLSASELVALELLNVPQNGYISPEAMVAGLVTLTRLRTLCIGFRSPESRPDRIRLPPTTRSILYSLTYFEFHGAREYLEDFVAQIDAPRLDSIDLLFLNQLIEFEVPQLTRFINHPNNLKGSTCCSITLQLDRITFRAGPSYDRISFSAGPSYDPEAFDVYPRHIFITILCEGIDWQFSHLIQALSQTSAELSNIANFAICVDSSRVVPDPEDMDGIEWLQLLRLFSSVQTLFVSRIFAGHISCALENIGEVTATEILPALDMLCLEDQPESSIDKFIAVRQNSGRPVTVIDKRMQLEERLKSYAYPG